MLKRLIPTLFAVFAIVTINYAQRSPFRSGYFRIGFNNMGKSIDNGLSAIDNITSGNLGAKKGYTFEFGHIYYFNKYSDFPVKFGLDWTIPSFTYNKLDWVSYVASKGDANATIGDKKLAMTLATKLGPNFSFNPVEYLVIDARVQLAYAFYFFDLEYYAHQGEENESHFSFIDYQNEDSDPEKFSNRVKSAFVPNFGLTIRRKAIGVALDYMPSKVNYYYESNESHGKERFKVNSLQLKVSLTL